MTFYRHKQRFQKAAVVLSLSLFASGLSGCGSLSQGGAETKTKQSPVAPALSALVSSSGEGERSSTGSATVPASATATSKRPLLPMKEIKPLTYAQEIEASFRTLGIQGLGAGLTQSFFLQLSSKSFIENTSQVGLSTEARVALAEQVMDELKKGMLSSLKVHVQATEEALERVNKLSPAADVQSKHQSYVTMLEKELRYMRALSEVVSEGEFNFLTLSSDSSLLQSQALERSQLSKEELGRSTEVKDFLKDHWKIAHQDLFAPLKKYDSYTSLEHRTFFLDQSVDLHLLLKDIAAFFVQKPDASALLQKENLLLEKVQNIGGIQPVDEDLVAHYALYDWAEASHALVKQIKIYAEAHQDTAAVFNMATAAQDPDLSKALSYWLVCYFNANGTIPEVYIPEK